MPAPLSGLVLPNFDIELPCVQLQFVGAGGTGKTTLAQAIRDEWDVPFLPSVARDVQAEFGITHEDQQRAMTPEQRWDLQQEISYRTWARLEEAAASGKSYVSDRSPLDHLCYALLKSRGMMSGDLLYEWQRRCLEIMASTTLVVYFPTDLFEPPADGFRTADPVERAMQDALVRGFLAKWQGLSVLHMNIATKGSVEEATKKRLHHLAQAIVNVAKMDAEDGGRVRA